MLNEQKKNKEKLPKGRHSLRSKPKKLEPVEYKKNSRVERMTIEDVLRASDERYRPLFDNMLNGFAYCRIILDKKNRPADFIYIDVNNAFEKLTGLNKEDVIGKRVTEVMPGIKETHPELFDIYSEVALTGKETKFEIYFEPLGIWLFVSAYSPGQDYFVIMFENISEQKRAEEEREVMIKLLSLINSSNNMHETMRLVMVFLRDWSQCEAVGIRMVEGEDYPYFVTSGFSDEFVQVENSLCSVNETGEPVRDSQGRVFLECMCGNVISGRYDSSRPFFTRNGSFWTNSTTDLFAGTTEADRLAKIRNRCNTAGYESVALVPLRAGEKTFGLLQFNDKQRGRFTTERISLFERLADNLAIGLAQRKAEQDMEKSEEMFRSIFETNIIGVAICSPDKRWLYVNDRTCEILGYSRQELCRTTWDKLTHPDDLEADVSLFNRLLAGEIDKYDIEKRFIRKDGSIIYAKIYISCRRDRYGDVDYDIGLLEDITKRKRAEEALQESEIRFRELFENMSSGVAVYEAVDDGKDFVFKNMNRAGELIEKIRRADEIDKKVTEVFPGVKDFGLFEVFQRVWRTGKPEYHPVSFYKDGRISGWRENYVYKLPTGEIVAVYDDVTERKKAEEKLYEYQNQLKSMASQVSKVQEQERRNIAVEMHDRISQHLAMAKVNIQIAAKSLTDTKVSEKLGKTAEEISRVIEDTYSLMVELSNPVLYEIGLRAAVESLLRKRIGPEKIEYTLEADDFKLDDVIRVPLYQAVRELLRNVIKHSKANKVIVSIRKADSRVQVEVTDNGVGFDTSIMGKPNKIKAGGFGLFSTKENIEYINGKLEIKSEPGRGTVAIITAPLEYKARADLGGK